MRLGIMIKIISAVIFLVSCGEKETITDPTQITIDPKDFEALPKNLSTACPNPKPFTNKDAESFKNLPLMGAFYSKDSKQPAHVKAQIDDKRNLKLMEDDLAGKTKTLFALLSNEVNEINLFEKEGQINMHYLFVCPDKGLKIAKDKNPTDFYYLIPAKS